MVQAVGAELPELTAPDGSWLLERVADRAPAGPWSVRHAVVLPGAGGSHKVLAESTLAEVSRGLVEDGLEVVVAWGPGEEKRAASIAESAGNGIYLAPPVGARPLRHRDPEPARHGGGLRGDGPLGARTAVVSGAAAASTTPSGAARTRRLRDVSAAEILNAARGLATR